MPRIANAARMLRSTAALSLVFSMACLNSRAQDSLSGAYDVIYMETSAQGVLRIEDNKWYAFEGTDRSQVTELTRFDVSMKDGTCTINSGTAITTASSSTTTKMQVSGTISHAHGTLAGDGEHHHASGVLRQHPQGELKVLGDGDIEIRWSSPEHPKYWTVQRLRKREK